MRISFVILPLIAAVATSVAQPSSPDAGKNDAPPTPREAALDNLLAERESIKAFESAIAEARRQGVGEQAILEARFLYHVDRREDEAIAAMLPEFLKQRDAFKLEESAIFGVKEDWLAVIEYVQAIASLGKGDKDAFKTHITEAFWLSPRQAAAFAPHIERMRLEDCMKAVRIDFKTSLTPVTGGDDVTLEALIAGKKALLFHFWSPWSRECEAAMPDFVATAATLSHKGIAIASLLPDDSGKLGTDARAMIQPFANKPCGAWLADSRSNPFGRELRIQNLPAMVLVSTEGRVLFNGDPTDDGFWETLRKIDGTIQRPEAADNDGGK